MRPGHTFLDDTWRRTRRHIGPVARKALLPSMFLAVAAYMAPAASAESTAMLPVRWVAAPEGLNLRAAPDGAIRDTLPNRSAVSLVALPIDQDGETWYPVAVASTGEEGWMAGRYLADAPPPRPARSLEVRLSGGGHATIDAIEDGQVVRSMPAFAGADSAPTPTGSFRVQAHVLDLTTDMWAAKSGHEWQLPYFVQVDGDVGIHGPKIDLRTGQPVPGPSSGCLSPSLADSVWLFGWAETGTPVHITRG